MAFAYDTYTNPSKNNGVLRATLTKRRRKCCKGRGIRLRHLHHPFKKQRGARRNAYCTPCPALRSPSGKEFLWSEFTWANRISGNSTNGTYQIQFELPQYSEEGAWTIDCIELVDKNYNTRFLIPANLTAPQLAASTIQVQGWPRGREQQSFASATAAKGNATIQLSNLSLTYKGTTTPPIDPGTYTFVAFMDHSSTS